MMVNRAKTLPREDIISKQCEQGRGEKSPADAQREEKKVAWSWISIRVHINHGCYTQATAMEIHVFNNTVQVNDNKWN